MVMEFFLKKDLSEIQNVNESLVTEFLTEIAPNISAEVTTIFDDTSNVKEFVDKYNLDKNLLKNILKERRHNFDWLLYQLYNEHLNSHIEPHDFQSTTKSIQHSSEERADQETMVKFKTPEPVEVGEYFDTTISLEKWEKTLKDAKKEGADQIYVRVNRLGKYELHLERNVREVRTETVDD